MHPQVEPAETAQTSETAERSRLDALDKYRILDSEPEARFDDICRLAALVCAAPTAFIGFVAEHREWFKARSGWHIDEINRTDSICNDVIASNDIAITIIEDTLLDPRYCDKALVIGTPFIRFYAGAPIRTREAHAIGVLCVIDKVPRTLSAEQSAVLGMLARQIEALLELRRNIVELEAVIAERDDVQGLLLQAHGDIEATLAELRRSVEATYYLMHTKANATIDGIQLSQYFDTDFPGIFFIINAQGCLAGWNKRVEEVTGYSHDEVQHRRAIDFFDTDELKAVVQGKIETAFEEGSADFEANLMTRSGVKIPYYLASARVEIEGQPYLSGMGIDISATYRSEEAFELRNRAMQACQNAVIITDLNSRVEYVNPAFETMTGYANADILGRNCSVLQRDDTEQPELDNLRQAVRAQTEGSAVLRNYRKNGELFWNVVHIAPVRNHAGIVMHFVGVLNDVTEMKLYEGQLEHRANFDALTHLANRNLLRDRLRQAIIHAQRHKKIVTVGFVDLDNFKLINDRHGHHAGDEVLRTVADRLKACIRAQDTVARYGGDEFAFVLTEQAGEDNVAFLMQRLLRAIALPFMVGQQTMKVSCSIGISLYPRDGLDSDTLLRLADVAMYRAKESGRNTFQFYTSQVNQKVLDRITLETRLRHALENNEFQVEYEPLFNLKSGLIVGAESRLIWTPTDSKAVEPAEFLALAEQTGLIVPIGEWMIHRACLDNKALQKNGLRPIRVGVKIFDSQFNSAGLRKVIDHAITMSGMDARYLELDVTETLLMQNPDASITLLAELKECGLQLTADDVGKGYSSLAYLPRFGLDRLTIAASLVNDIGGDPEQARVARSVISLGHSLNLIVMAEGVRSAEQLAYLKANDCDEIKGELVGPALPFDQLSILLQQDQRVGMA
ncbi:sensor domain-containing phosphodiesterase [Actimicrobium antarcticum]|uniref:EAL domain-containing protein n=1 Tax=Actimicrobium antarcticum TaxID=1051899 RepID=A0ABP7TYH3_9BURK